MNAWIPFMLGIGIGFAIGVIIAIVGIAICQSANVEDDQLEKIQGGNRNGESKRD